MFLDDEMMTDDAAMPAASDDTMTDGAEETSHEEAPAAEEATHEEAAADGSEM